MSERIGTIVFFDLAAFSTERDPVQVIISKSFFKELRKLMNELWGKITEKQSESQYCLLPTGDGAAVVLWKGGKKYPQREHAALWLAGKMMLWAKTHNPEIGMRCGINQGVLDIINDPNRRTNVCGAAINVAQRVMDAASPGQILVRDEFAQRLAPGKQQLNDNFIYQLEPGDYEVLAKHNVILKVSNITEEFLLNNRRYSVGKSESPASKWHLQIEPPILALNKYGIKDKKKPPEKLLKKHSRITFVGATNDQLPDIIAKVLKSNSSKIWDSLTFYFLKDTTIKWMGLKSDDRSCGELIAAKEKTIKGLKRTLKGHVKNLEFREHDRPFYFASYWDWDSPGGRIHISPYIWGADVRDCPAFDYTWVTKQPTKQYQDYRNGLENLKKVSRLINS